jgi:hypothetical protein
LVFELREGGIEFRLEIVRLERAVVHEEIVPEILEKLLRDIERNGVVKDPVVVDSESFVVLDGMHRVAALEKLGCTRLPACEVEYRRPEIKIGCWYRVVDGFDRDKLVEVARLLGLEVRECSDREALRSLEQRKAVAAFRDAVGCLLLVGGRGGDVLESYAWVKRLELAMREEGADVRYELEKDAERSINGLAVLMVPCVTKQEVVELALGGHVFAHKTTRHVIPWRPVNIRVPLEWLREEVPIEEANRMLEDHLRERKRERLPPGSEWEGRRYEEPLIVFR